jgi:hypothetical protein
MKAGYEARMRAKKDKEKEKEAREEEERKELEEMENDLPGWSERMRNVHEVCLHLRNHAFLHPLTLAAGNHGEDKGKEAPKSCPQ